MSSLFSGQETSLEINSIFTLPCRGTLWLHLDSYCLAIPVDTQPTGHTLPRPIRLFNFHNIQSIHLDSSPDLLLPKIQRLGQADKPSGAGPIGLVTALAAHAAGCTPIVLTDLVASRLEFAKTLLPNIKTVQIQKGQSPEVVSEMIKKEAGGMVSVALECTGF
jgi:hypothetical protein